MWEHLLFLAERFSPRPWQAASEESLSELPRVCAAFLASVAKAVKSAAAPAQVGGVEHLFEAPRAAAVLRLEGGQALPAICESVLRLTLSARAGLAEAFLESVLMFALSDPCLSCPLPSQATGTKQQLRQAK